MSFASILSGPTAPEPPPKPAVPPPEVKNNSPVAPLKLLDTIKAEALPDDKMQLDPVPPVLPPTPTKPVTIAKKISSADQPNGTARPQHTHPDTLVPRKSLTSHEHGTVMRVIENIESGDHSDLEELGFEDSRQEYLRKRGKRSLEHENEELVKRKVSSHCPAVHCRANLLLAT